MKKEEAGTPGLATASLVFGILSVVLGWVPLLGWILVILAFVFGAIALKKIKAENLPGKGMAVAGELLGLVGLVLAITMMVFISGTGTTPSAQYNLDIESAYSVDDLHQVNQSFSVQNTGSKAATNVVVEVYLLAPDQNISQSFTYLDHKQIIIGTLNSGQKTNVYSTVVGQESPDSDYSAFVYLKASSAEGDVGSATSDVLSVSAYSMADYRRKIYCSKIDPYNLDVRKAAAEAVRAHPGAYSFDQALDIYDWVKLNIIYLNVPETISPPYSPSETLTTKAGDCKNQAVLLASMIESIGGKVMLVSHRSCQHAYVIVHITDEEDVQSYVDTLGSHYTACNNGFICGGKCWGYSQDTGSLCDGTTAVSSDICDPGQVGFTDDMCHSCSPGQTLILKEGEELECRDNFDAKWFDYEGGKWLIFDPAGGELPGNLLPECAEDEAPERYFIESCVNPPE